MLTYAKKDWTTSRLSCARWRSFDWLLGFEVLCVSVCTYVPVKQVILVIRWRSFDWLLGFEVLCVSVCTFVPVKQVILKNPLPLHLRRRNARCSSAVYVSIRSSAAYVSIRLHLRRRNARCSSACARSSSFSLVDRESFEGDSRAIARVSDMSKESCTESSEMSRHSLCTPAVSICASVLVKHAKMSTGFLCGFNMSV
jgi:hypothetical protein